MQTVDWIIRFDFARQALVAAVAVGTLCSLLSVVVVLKRMAFIGQGISHAGFGGIGLALFLGMSEGLARDAVVLLFCLATALVIGLLSRRRRVETDTAIGVLLVATMALGVVLNSLRGQSWYVRWMGAPRAISYESVLFGSINNVGREGMWLALLAAIGVLLVCAALFKEIVFYTFDESVSRVFGVPTTLIHHLLLALLTVTIVVSMKLAGVVLVTALLVIPGATALQLSQRLGRVLLLAWGVGMVGTVGGLVLSFELGELPTGPCIVATLCAVFAAVFLARSIRHT